MTKESILRSVTLSNTLARASQGLSLSEKRIISLALAQINPRQTDSRELALAEGFQVDVSAASYATAFSVSLDMAYAHLKAAGASLPGIEVCYNSNRIRWASNARYHSDRGACLEIQFTKEIAAHLIELPGQFISYKLQDAVGLKSIFAWRLYECLETWRLKKGWSVSIEDFYTAMDATDGYKGDFGSLRTRVIEPAVSGIKDKYLSLTWKRVKEGRRVTAIQFDFEKPFISKHGPAGDAPVNKKKPSHESAREQAMLDQMSDKAAEEEYRKNFPQDFPGDDDDNT